jgi:hypothetical protein
MTIELWGSLTFGTVIGYVTYRTLRRTKATGLSDITAVIGAVGGGAVTLLFPAGSRAFGAYGIGLAAGFFAYLIIALVVAKKTGGLSAANEWLGEGQPGGGARPQVADASGSRTGGLPPVSDV